MRLFKKHVIFYMNYKDKHTSGHRSKFCEYSIFTNKNKIIKDFNDWVFDTISERDKYNINNYTITTNLKILGL